MYLLLQRTKMSSNPPFKDPSDPYAYRYSSDNTDLNTSPTTPPPHGANDQATLFSSASLAANMAARPQIEQQLLQLRAEDPRAAIFPAFPLRSPYEDALVRQVHASNMLRQYNEMRRREAVSAALNPHMARLTGTADMRLPPGVSQSHASLRSPSFSETAPVFGLTNESPPMSAMARAGLARMPPAAFTTAGSRGDTVTGSFPTATSKVPTPAPSSEMGKLVANDAQEDEEAFFRLSGSKERFPIKLYRMIYEMEKEGRTDVISFLPHGKAFAVHNEATFVKEVLPRYFANCQLPSFQKQLNLYGFHKITVGKDKGKLRYFHSSFLKGRPSLTNKIQRRRTSAASKRKQS